MFMLLAFSSLGLYGHFNKGFPNRFSEEILFFSGFNEAQRTSRINSCSIVNGFKLRERCVIGNKDNIKGVLFGDSHAYMLWQPLNQEMERLDIGIMSFTGGGCPPILEIWRRDSVNECHQYNKTVFDFIKSNDDIEYIILSGRWTIHIERSRFDNREGFVEYGADVFSDVINDGNKEVNSEVVRKEKLLEKVRDSVTVFDSLNRELFVVYPVPEVGFMPAERLIQEIRFTNKKEHQLTHSYEVFLNRNKKIRDTFNEVREQTKSAVYFDISDNLCSAVTGRCKTFNENGMPLYYDDDHLSSYGSELIVQDIVRWISLNESK
jgi:hypothetical protein